MSPREAGDIIKCIAKSGENSGHIFAMIKIIVENTRFNSQKIKVVDGK